MFKNAQTFRYSDTENEQRKIEDEKDWANETEKEKHIFGMLMIDLELSLTSGLVEKVT